MKEMFWVGLGGFVGATARYWLAGWLATRLGAAFPYGTFVINVSGSFALGLLMGAVETHAVSPVIRIAVAIGFLGAYTTFSTFTYETLRLVEDGSLLLAIANVLGSLVLGFGSAIVGVALGRVL